MAKGDEIQERLIIAVKELSESEVWLRMVVTSNMLLRNQVAPLLNECNQLQRILSASIKTARQSASP